MMEAPVVRVMNKEDEAAAVDTIVLAFAEDPVPDGSHQRPISFWRTWPDSLG